MCMYKKIAFVKNSPTNTSFINSKCFHGTLHAIKAGTLPYKVHTKTMAQVHWNSLLFLLITVMSKNRLAN